MLVIIRLTFCQYFTPGDLHWKQVSFSINSTLQVELTNTIFYIITARTGKAIQCITSPLERISELNMTNEWITKSFVLSR